MEVITMTQNQNLRRDGRFWMLVAMATCAVGFFVGLLGLAMVGAGVSGSGCGKACTAQRKNARWKACAVCVRVFSAATAIRA